MSSSLRQLLERHRVVLLIDSVGPVAQAIVWRAGVRLAVASVPGEASTALPLATGQALSAAGLRVGEADAAAYCAGPGSVLGARLAAATVRAWRAVRPGLEVYAYLGLPLLSLGSGAAAAGIGVITDARRDTWHAVLPRSPGEIQRLPNPELAAPAARWACPAGFRRWTTPPTGIVPDELPYHVADLLDAASDAPLFDRSTEPEAWLSEAPSYVEWTPRVHQAPTP